MKKAMTSVPFHGTAEQLAALDAVIAEHIAAELDIPYSEVFGVVTFYSQFQLNPKGAHPVAVCLGTACYVKGSGIIMEKLEEMLGIKSGAITSDLRFSLDATRCIGACGLAPVMTIGEDVYGRLEPSMLKDILAKYQD